MLFSPFKKFVSRQTSVFKVSTISDFHPKLKSIATLRLLKGKGQRVQALVFHVYKAKINLRNKAAEMTEILHKKRVR